MQINLYSYEFSAPIGNIGIAESDGSISRVIFNLAKDDLYNADILRLIFSQAPDFLPSLVIGATKYTDEAASQLSDYLDGKRAEFNLQLSYSEHGFSNKVYSELLRIPAGQTRSYRDIAVACGAPKAYRAVGMINRNNTIPFFIPCDRVIGSNGNLTGYAGGLPMKQYLLELEAKYYADTTV